MRIEKYIGILIVGMSAIGTTAVMAKRAESAPKKKSEGFAEKARKLKEQQEQKQEKMGVLSNRQEEDLQSLLDEYNKAKDAKAKVRIGSHLMPLAEKYLQQLTQRNVLSSLLRDKQEMELVGKMATVIGDLQGHMKDAGTGIFTKIRKDLKKLTQNLLTEETYE